jgi:hypothetical protein
LGSRRLIVLCLVLGIAAAGWLIWRNVSLRSRQATQPVLSIEKQPVSFANRRFDRHLPPADMPPLAYGEEAQCDSNFLSNTSVGGESKKTDGTHATVTITKIKMILQLRMTIWAPSDTTPHVIEHEEGHRQISEYYYQTADKLAERIAATYMGKQIEVSGANLDGEFDKVLQQTAGEINNEYGQELNAEATQEYFDSITDHGRNETDAKEAVTAAIENMKLASIQSPGKPAK